ncbi:hypothetical protein NQ318_006658 [Aromia moschata]|uniref:Golgin subfamily B member 1 n=1 Tax=Aromia moschata TaxID=1265417 RepID=A0AAV8YQ88_9CUCU|nr:hypothetical protein NQ318_006658 [Aromia moschata]
MIKIKAQSKSKIKQLTKNINAFKKGSDTNALIVQLQAENTKLSEKIAELEEEKGNMQLKMVESTDSVKDSNLLEEHKELENRLAKQSEELQEKDKIISLLESEEVISLTTKVSGLSHLENVEVTSEIKSIQIEEQMEKVENENAKLKKEIEDFEKEKEELIEKIEELKKEKHELNTKLENYIQENMDLIDKLEKLSAEKVSSAESIEIVEGLTQQEKLELAAYQKNMDVHIEGEPIKCPEDDVMEPPTELNESVLQLSEDSTELLQKIDMFTIERKEVMVKMEALKEENNQLSLKVKEIENNRDILAETYEQLQNEKEDLQNDYDELTKKFRQLEAGEVSLKVLFLRHPHFQFGKRNLRIRSFHEVAKNFQVEYEKLLTENSELKRTLKEYDSKVHEKHNLESELSEAREKIEVLETKLKSNLEDLTFYQSVVEENKTELINSANIINKLQTKLDERENDIKELNIMINDLNGIVNNLQMENNKLGDFGVMETQVAELKSSLNDQIQQAQDYEEEISRNNDIIEDLNAKLIDMNKKIIETEHEMEMKAIETKKLEQELQNKKETINNLQHQVQEKDKKIHIVVEDMKQKYLSLQKQLDGNSDSLESKVTELTNKNKEQIEKMKKIAANLKKKTQAYHELEAKYSGEKEKWETEVNEKESIIADSKGKIETILRQKRELEEEIVAKTRTLAKAEAKINELTDLVNNLEQNKVELQNTLLEFRRREEKLNEVSLKQELSTSLHEEFDPVISSQESAKEEKVKELELIIETNQNALTHYTERVHKLEEDIARLVEEKEMAEKKAHELSEQLNITTKNAEEKALAEEELGQRLAQVTASDEELVKKLEEIGVENKELTEKNKKLEELNYKLKVKVKQAHEKVTQLKSLQANMEELETTNGELKKQLAILEANQRHIQDENEELQKQNRSDYERIEADYQVQMEELVRCKNELTVECEKLQETLKEIQSREEELLAEMAEYKLKMEQKEAENLEKIGDLQDEVKAANFNWNDSLKEIESLNKIIDGLQTELVTKVATETVESVITEATEKVITRNTVSCQATVEIKDIECQSDRTENSVACQVMIKDTDCRRDRAESSVSCQAVVEITDIECQRDKDENTTASQTDNVEIQQTKTTEGAPTMEPVSTFHWPENQEAVQTQNWFTAAQPTSTQDVSQQPFTYFNTQEQSSSNVLPPYAHPFHIPSQPEGPVPLENTKEELMNKIRALEVLLYNMDKEKEEALLECTEMINELTHLLYEKVSAAKSETSHSSGTPKAESSNVLSGIESQIMSVADVTDATSKKKELHDIEFEKSDVSLGEQSHPVVEEVARPKRAYLTYQPEDKISMSKLEAFGENDDGWGWGPEEAKLEEEHMHKAESTPQMQSLRNEIAQLTEKLSVLQVERENYLEEIKQLQIKSGKLIKKCKELKLKNDQLMGAQHSSKKSETSDFFNLDATIQEELKSQISQLEKKIKELTNELDKEKQEKSNALKRVDVLTAANERMIEMKEIQDTEVLRWKRKHQEAEEKLHNYQWGSDGFNEGTKPKESQEIVFTPSTSDANRIEELQQTIKELSADNDELQALLDEQRQLRIDAEKSRTLMEATITEEEYAQLIDKIKSLEQELANKAGELQVVLQEKDVIVKEKIELQTILNEKEKLMEQLQMELTVLTQKNSQLEQLLADKDKQVRSLQESEKTSSLQQELTQKITLLENFISQLNETVQQQELLLNEKEVAYNELKMSFGQTNMLKEELELQVSQLTTDLEQQRENYAQLQSENMETTSSLEKELCQQQQKCDQLESASLRKINELSSELEKQKQAYSELQEDNFKKLEQLTGELEQQKLNHNQLMAEYSQKISDQELLKQQMGSRQHESLEKDVFELAQQKHQLEGSLAEKDGVISELTNKKVELEDEVDVLKKRLEEKSKEYDEVVSDVEVKISKTVTELEQTWMAQVDQRGADVAESWKLHLDSVEAEYTSVQEKLKYEINELEEKCNALVNENNELRKNVDAEIRNEVDRISALQQQINDRQQYITELNNKLIEKQNENEDLIGKLMILQNETEQLRIDFMDRDSKLASMNVIIETTQNQFEEKREVVEEIVRILERNTSWPLSFEKQEILMEFQRQLNLAIEKDQEIHKLNQSINELQIQINTIQEKDQEISNLKHLVDDLQKQIATIEEKDNEIYQLTTLVQESQTQLTLTHDKDGEIFRLNKLVEGLQKDLGSTSEKQEEISRLNQANQDLQLQLKLLQEYEGEIYRLNQVIENYQLQQNQNQQELAKLHDAQSNANLALEDYKRRLEELQTSQMALYNSVQEKDQLIVTLNQQLQSADNLKNDNNKDIDRLQEEIIQSKKDCSNLQDSLVECQQQLFAVTSDLANKTQELEGVNQQLAYSQRNYEILDAELNKMKDFLQVKEQEYASSVENLRKGQLRDLESHYEEVLAAKDLDIQNVKSQLQESIHNSQQLTDAINFEANLRQQLEENAKQLEEKVANQSALLDEEDKQLIELRSIIEEQVIKIEELKKELFEKSRDYDSLIAEIDIGRKAITEQPTHSANMSEIASTSKSERSQQEDDLSEPVSRAELDLALYMLHQRDVRCEELTMELTQLLEERDTLQLRLSNAIREKEEIRRKLPGSEEVVTPSASGSSPATPLSKSSAIFLAASGTELATEPQETTTSVHNLESKLSELKRVGYKKDKTFVDEQELRRMQQMSIMQQHIHEASKLPPEAAAKLVDASYTLCRTVKVNP